MSGFTLIELLIAVSVILIFSGLSLASFNQFNEAKKLEAETKKFIEVLELAKKKITSGDKSNLSEGSNNYSGCDLTEYKVTITLPSEYSIKAKVCDNGEGGCDLTSGSCQDINIHSFRSSQDITLSSSGDVVFQPFGKVSTEVCITITNTVTGKAKYVKVEQSGTISIVSSCS